MAQSYPNLKCVLLSSFSFFVLYLAFFSTVTITSKVLRENGYKNLGFYSVGTLYFCFSAGCLIAPTIATLMSYTRLLQISAFTITLWILTGLLTSMNPQTDSQTNEQSMVIPILVIIVAALNGFGSSVLWVTQSKYLSECIKICEHKTGLYTSIFWTLTLGSQIFSFILNSIVLGYFSQQTLYIITSGISLIAIGMFGCLPQPQLPMGYIQPNNEKPFDSIKQTFKTFSDIRIMKLGGLFINSGDAGGIGQGLLVPFYCKILHEQTLEDQMRISSFIMVAYGFGCILGGQIIGIVNDKFGGGKTVTKASLLICIATYSSFVFCNEINQYNSLCFISAFLLGITNTASNTQLSIIISIEFQKSAPAFGVQNIVKNISIGAIQIIASQISTQAAYRLFFFAIGLQNVISQLIVLMTFKFRDISSNKSDYEARFIDIKKPFEENEMCKFKGGR